MSEYREYEKITKRFKNAIFDNLTEIIVVLLFIIAFVYSFLRFTLVRADSVADSAIQSVYIFAITSGVFLVMQLRGKARALDTETYKGEAAQFARIYNAVLQARKLDAVAKFVKDYVQEDFEAYQASILRVQGKGITFEEYKKYYEQLSLPVLLQVRVRSGSESPETEKPTRKNYPNQKEYRTARKEYSIRKKAYELTLSQKFAILHAQYAKPIKLSAEGLCSCGEKIRKSRSVPITGETAMQVSRLKRLLLFALVSMPLGLYTIQASVRFTVDSLVLFVQIIFLMTIGGGLGYFSGRSAFLNLQVRNLTYREDKLLIMCERESIKIDNQNN